MAPGVTYALSSCASRMRTGSGVVDVTACVGGSYSKIVGGDSCACCFVQESKVAPASEAMNEIQDDLLVSFVVTAMKG